jgi:phage shock protein C
MPTRTRKPVQEREETSFFEEHELAELEGLSDDELEALLFEEETREPSGLFNLPTIAGFSLILVGIAYLLQKLGLWTTLDLSVLAGMLPWLAGILIILVGFGVLSWRPRSNRKRRRAERKAEKAAAKVAKRSRSQSTSKTRVTEDGERRRLQKSPDKKLAGVAGGIAEYFNIDPTLVRIGFVIGTIASGGPFFLAYIVLAFVMPNPDKPTLEERITIIRDS